MLIVSKLFFACDQIIQIIFAHAKLLFSIQNNIVLYLFLYMNASIIENLVKFKR